MFESIQPAPPDPILGLSEAYKEDSHPLKINLGVGVYQNERGITPILECVKQAENILLKQESSKGYAPISGEPEYGRAVRKLIFGEHHDLVNNGRAVTCHAPGGTGALRVGADFLRKQFPNAPVWLSNPTWANHKGIFGIENTELKAYPYYDAESKALNFSGMMNALESVRPGDIVLMHVSCHNPTGQDPDPEQWEQIAALLKEKGALPFLDFAYQGFKESLEADREPVLYFTERDMDFLVATSFSKNLGLYGERVGGLTLVSASAQSASDAFSQLKRTVRTHYSNPPIHGGRIVQTVTASQELSALWLEELRDMRERIADMRKAFVEGMKERVPEPDFSFLLHQYGMFSFSGLTDDQVDFLRDDKSIYIVRGGRINVAGITPSNLDYLCNSVAEALEV